MLKVLTTLGPPVQTLIKLLKFRCVNDLVKSEPRTIMSEMGLFHIITDRQHYYERSLPKVALSALPLETLHYYEVGPPKMAFSALPLGRLHYFEMGLLKVAFSSFPYRDWII